MSNRKLKVSSPDLSTSPSSIASPFAPSPVNNQALRTTKTGDPRLVFIDVFVTCLSLVSEKEIQIELAKHCEPDTLLMATWMNTVRFEKKYREVRGLDSIAYYLNRMVMQTPDIVIKVQERTLYERPNGSSFLVCKLSITGTLYLTIMMKNALHAAARHIFSRNSFFPKMFSVDETVRSDTSTLPPEVMNNILSSSASSDSSDVASPSDHQALTLKQESQPAPMRRKPAVKRRQQYSMAHRSSFFTLRRQKIHVDQMEIATSDTHMDLSFSEHPTAYTVSSVLVFHINAANKVYKVENFKRKDHKVFL